MRKGTHYNRYIQSCYNKLGEPRIIILQSNPLCPLVEAEQKWINKLSPILNSKRAFVQKLDKNEVSLF